MVLFRSSAASLGRSLSSQRAVAMLLMHSPQNTRMELIGVASCPRAQHWGNIHATPLVVKYDSDPIQLPAGPDRTVHIMIMMPPHPNGSSGWFLPYVYVPSEGATYAKLVTPWGSVHLGGILKDEMLNIAIALGVVALSIGAFCLLRSSKAQSENVTVSDAHGAAQKGSAKDSKRSALEENIVSKGENSYYYAHQARVVSENASALQKTMVSMYGWTDSKKSVSIYLTDDVVVDMNDEQLKLKWSKTSLAMDLIVDAEGKHAKSLVIPSLYNEITDVTWKVKKNQLTITLTKAEASPWISLNGAAKNLEEHIKYDESLYD